MVAKLKRQVKRLRQQCGSPGSGQGNPMDPKEGTEQAAGEDKSGESSEDVDANNETEQSNEESEGQNQAGNAEEGGKPEVEDEEEEERTGKGDEKEEQGDHEESPINAKEEIANEEGKGEGQAAKRITLGCEWRYVAAPPPPPPLNASQGISSALNGGGGLFDWLFSWEGGFSSEVSLNNKGGIRAHHDNPHSHLMPRNKYQNARSTSEAPTSRACLPRSLTKSSLSTGFPGILTVSSMFVKTRGGNHQSRARATHLFADHIAPTAPGFNAGMGRRVRAQQAYDWDHTMIVCRRTH
eukprot:766443-Hanusia_phi.AAC.4